MLIHYWVPLMRKRFFDLLVSVTLIVFFMPLMLLISIFSYIIMGPPVLFRQLRPGLKGKLFTLYKFRSMLDIKDCPNELLEDQSRLTKFGKFLRKTSLDELPQLWNVVKGDMSLVGPRPLLVEYLSLYTAEQNRRHEVRPGITGWAQVNGRNCLNWEDRLRADVWYVNNYSFMLDLRILALTFLKVLKREGVSEEGQATMSKFTGNSDEK